jgi:hypothetical protein
MQPAPIITRFNPEAGATGDQVTISGNHFNGVTEVKFDNAVATIVSKSNQELKVNVPAGVTSAFITVTTPVGSVTSLTRFGFKYIIYDERLLTGCQIHPTVQQLFLTIPQPLKGEQPPSAMPIPLDLADSG